MSAGKEFEKLVEIMAKLRSDEGCPWDREQTHKSLRRHLLEEAYEVIEAIDSENPEQLKTELGDLLLQVVFHAQLAAEAGHFSIEQVVESINEKLIRRHPHVFGEAVIRTAQEQIVAWEKSKLKREGKKSVIDGVPKHLPALLRAHRLQSKAAAVGFDWPQAEPVWEKLEEEIRELKEAVAAQNESHIEEEFGDLLFTLVNLGRFIKVEPEEALRRTIEKFERRFRQVEAQLQNQGRSMADATLDEMDREWENVKKAEQRKAD
ncbi:MAG: nucleoside triphosphate pyrophosphohydrolase [candidate division KSB1 bacterium]|nr:nucleoside triphosphate pyrophosphohydrolase [candidate division KSB1 bacterium]